MSGEILREAAALMRARAEAATPGPWWALSEDYEVVGDSPVSLNPEGDDFETASMDHVPNRQHVASWHPGIALAVADWLDDTANANERLAPLAPERDLTNRRALAVAHAYLDHRTATP